MDAESLRLKFVINPTPNSPPESISQNLGLEQSAYSYEWYVLVDPKPMTLNVKARVNKDNDFEIYWDKPDPYYGEVDYYLMPPFFVNSPQTTDTFYVLHDIEINIPHSRDVRAYFKDSYLEYWEGGVIIDSYTEITAEELSNDSLRISWNPVFNAVYDLTIGDNSFIDYKDTCVTVGNIPFGYSGRTKIRLKVKLGDFYINIERTYKRGVAIASNGSDIYYNPIENVLYSREYGDVSSYKLPELTFIAKSKTSVSENTELIYSLPNSPKILTIGSNVCDIFSGKELVKERSIILTPFYSAIKQMAYNDANGALYLLSTPFYGTITCETYDYQNGTKTNSYPLKDIDYEEYSSIAPYLSSDGRYIFIRGRKNGVLSCYEETTQGYVLIYEKEIPFDAMVLHPFHKHELYIQKGNSLEVMDMADFGLKRKIAIPDGRFCDIDPKNGNILLSTEGYAVILTPEGTPILKVANNDYNQPYQLNLKGDALISGEDALDISKYF